MKGPQKYRYYELAGMGTVWVWKGPSPEEPFVWYGNKKGGDRWGCMTIEEFRQRRHDAQFGSR